MNIEEIKAKVRENKYLHTSCRNSNRHYIDLFDRAINRTQITQVGLIFADFRAYAALLGNQKHKNQRKSGKSGKSAFH